MNQKIEIKKIKVNNGQELIQKAKEYKNSGGEWKFWEKYWTSPGGQGGKNTNKKYTKWGIIISNGKQKINIFSDKVKDWGNGGEGVLTNRLDEVDSREELHQLFPEAQFACFAGGDKEHDRYGGRPIQSRLDFNTFKPMKEADGEYDLIRYLVAENSWHLKQILHQYVHDNESKIYQSVNPNFSGWVEIIDGQDGNMYLYVGEKKGWGREIKIGIKKEEFYNKEDHNFYTKSGGGYCSAEEMLEMAWNLFTIGRPRTPAETREYYSSNGGLEEEWKRNWPHRGKLCRQYLEELRGRMSKKFNYWQEKTRQKEYWDHEANEQGLLAKAHISEIDHELEDMKKNRPTYYAACDKDCEVCGVKLCCHHEGQACSENKNRLFSDFHGDDCKVSSLEKSSGSEKLQILQYFIAKNIKKITLDNGKLVFEYNSGDKKIMEENKDQQLQKWRQFIQNLPSQSLSFSDLQKNSINNSYDSAPNKNNIGTYIGLTAGAVILGGVFVYFLARKRKGK
jgi:hypothetical protein